MMSTKYSELKKLMIRAKYFLMAFVSTLAICANYVIAENADSSLNVSPIPTAASGADNSLTTFILKFQHSFVGNSLAEVIIIVSLFLLYVKVWKNAKKNLVAVFLSIICSLCYIVGKSYAVIGSDVLILSNTYQIVFSLICYCGLFLFLTCVFHLCINMLDTITLKVPVEENWCKKRCIYFLLIFLSWLPYMIAYYPGCMPFDTFGQLNQYLGLTHMSNHFPIVSTYLVGWSYSIGNALGSNLGLFIYVIVQALIGALAFLEVCIRIEKIGLPKIALYIALGFYCIIPIWATSVVCIVKDYTYYPIMLLYVLIYIDMVRERKLGNWKRIVKYIILSVLTVFFRNEAIYIIVISTLFLLITMKKWEKIKILIIAIILIVMHSGYMDSLDRKGLIAEYDKKEAYSAFFQQTARYIQYYEDELTEEEIEIINQTLDYGAIKKVYTPGLSDPVKENYRCPNEEDWEKYKDLWFKCFLKHPKVYMDSIITGCYGYFLPGYNFPRKETYFLVNVFDKYEPEGLGISYLWSDDVRSVFEGYANIWKNSPVLSILVSPGIYSWIMLFNIVVLVCKRKIKECIAFIPYLLVLGVCCVSPVTGLLRYAIPYIAGMPLMITYTIHCLKKGETSYGEI